MLRVDMGVPGVAAKIRERRAEDISRAALAHMAVGGSIYMVTLTARHRIGHRLAPLLSTVIGGFRQKLISGRAWIAEREAIGVIGTIRSTEVTYGGNGWHPHLHVLVFCQSTPDPVDLARAIDRWSTAWRSRRAAGDGHEAVLRRLAGKLLGQLHHCLEHCELYREDRAWPQPQAQAT